MYEHILALEDEAAGLRAQLKRFSRRVSSTAAAVIGSVGSLSVNSSNRAVSKLHFL